MKTSLRFASLLALLCAAQSASAAPETSKPQPPTPAPVVVAAVVPLTAEIAINPPDLSPESTIDLRFPTPMIAKDRIGSTEATSPISISPPLTGSFHWTSSRSGIYRLSQTPRFNQTYSFSLRSGLTDLTGKPIESGLLDEMSSDKFRIVEQYPKWMDETDAPRLPKFLFEFNDLVEPAAVAVGMAFKCASTKERIEVKVRHATSKDYKHYAADPLPTWAEQMSKTAPAFTAEGSRANAIIVEPVSPLNVGKGWILDIASTVTNKSGAAKIAVGDAITIGEIAPFIVDKISAHSPFDRPRFIDVDFSDNLIANHDTDAERAAEVKAKLATYGGFVKIEPPVTDLKLAIDANTLRLSGSFELGTPYKVHVEGDVISGEGVKLSAAAESIVAFAANPPYLAVPSFINAQLATGSGEFEFVAANVTQVRVRARRMNGPELMRAIDDYQDYISANQGGEKARKNFKAKPFDDFPGTVVFDRTFPINKPLDQSAMNKLNWREILGAGNATAPLFIELEGTAMAGIEGKRVLAQTLVEFTDLGVFQKDDFQTSTIHVVSLKTGKPVAKARVTLADAEHRLLGYGDTDDNGLVSIKAKEVAYVLAEKDGDCTALEATDSSTFIPLWHHNIATLWDSPWEPERRTFVFADRPIYKPGETAHIRAYSRLAVGDDLRLDGQPTKAILMVRDPGYRVVLEKPVTFSATGAWSDDVLLPSGPTGHYGLTLLWPKADGTYDQNDDSSGDLSLLVTDYKPNTFEVAIDGGKADIKADRVTLPLAARYYMGKGLSQAKVSWNAYREPAFDVPEPFADYHFGDAPRWAHYGEDRDPDDSESDDNDDPAEWDAAGEGTLTEDGTYAIEMPAPPADRSALPQHLRIEATVTDINEQTISASTPLVIPGAAFIVGLKGPQFYATAGQPVALEAIAITSAGRAHSANVAATLKIERQDYNTIKVETAGGGLHTKNQAVLQEEFNQSIVLKPTADGQPASASIDFTPKAGGIYFATIESQDSTGRKLLSRMPFYAIGGSGFPWAMGDGNTIDLQPDKKTLKPGEKATIVVKTPIAGSALVTVERSKIQRHFMAQISPTQPTIEVPVFEEDAPNVFVSVMLVRGAADSPQKTPMPEYRVGYCELTVESKANVLAMKVSPDRDTVKPGETVTMNTVITDAAGKPVPNAEVTLAAVDEGVLSLMTYKTPDPVAYFHDPKALAVRSRTNFDSLIAEDDTLRSRGNKGFVIGGGGDEMDAQLDTRKNFLATALWTAMAVTNERGEVKASFTAPDNLTRYRLMAVASEGAMRFGHGESSVTINKPLMVDPALPRFARTGDELLVKAIVHNTTTSDGTVDVSLTLDSHADFITAQRPYILPSQNPESTAPAGKVWHRTLRLKAKETASVAFPLTLTSTGTTKWTWAAKTQQWSGEAQSDGTESTFNIEPPVPERREVRYFAIDGKTPPESLSKDINPALLEGKGSATITLATSPVYEAADALDYVLTYPYGCVEQTTSSMMPYLALGGYNEMFPDKIIPAQAQQRIQVGVNRLLQMTTTDGGLSYWPGGQEATLWGTAYGGFALMKARDMGATVPPAVINELLDYLSKALRQLEDEKEPHVLCDSAFALYTLAKGKKPEPGYMNLMYAKREKLPQLAKIYLALAMLISDMPETQAATLLGVSLTPPPPPKPVVAKAEPKKPAAKGKATAKSKGKGKTTAKKPAAKPVAPPPPPPVWNHWVGPKVNMALKLICYSHMGLKDKANEAATILLSTRNGRGEWGNTFTNAWALTALSAYDRSLKVNTTPLATTATWGSQSVTLDLPKPMSIARGSFALSPELTAVPMKLALPADRKVSARVEARGFSALREFAGENKGFGITRQYHRLLPTGEIEEANNLRVGDLIKVTLVIDTPGGEHYLAINDPLPAVFEALNPEFDTQKVRNALAADDLEPWFCDHRELRTDRALFFTDNPPGKGKFTLSYLARVGAEGDAIAPSAKIEAMYEPDHYGLSATQRVRTLPSQGGPPVAAK